MITDSLLALSAAQAVTATANSTNVIDLSQARDVGEGTDLICDFRVNTAFTAGGSATMTAAVVVSAAAALTTPTTIASTSAIPVASLVSGYNFALKLNQLIASLGLRYLGVIYTIATGPMTAGAISANIVTNVADGQKDYPSGFVVA